MGAIRGDLSVLSIANLVQALVLDRSVGLLTVESGSDRRILRVSPAGIRLVRGSQRCHRLERLLRRFSRFTSEWSDEGLVVESLPSRGMVARLVREWMMEEICEMFTWSRGTFIFRKDDAGVQTEEGPFAKFAGDCDVTKIALEAARWADELPRIKSVIRDLRLIPSVTAPAVPLQKSTLDPEALDDVYRLIDGKRPVVQILQMSVFPRFVVLQILYGLTVAGAIRMEMPSTSFSAAA
jgi:hypothetical protein